MLGRCLRSRLVRALDGRYRSGPATPALDRDAGLLARLYPTYRLAVLLHHLRPAGGAHPRLLGRLRHPPAVTGRPGWANVQGSARCEMQGRRLDQLAGSSPPPGACATTGRDGL